MIRIKRRNDPPRADGGRRFLSDRLWSRGIAKAAPKAESWVQDIAPSDRLGKYFQHDLARWPAVQQRYLDELREHPEGLATVVDAARGGTPW